MMLRKISILVILLWTAAPAWAQTNYEPLELAKRIFGASHFSELQTYCTGDYEGMPNGESLVAGVNTKFTVLEQNNQSAVIAIAITDSLGKGMDAYLYFEKDSIWKMNNFRSLAMTGIIEQVKQELESMTEKEINKAIAKSKTEDNTALFSSRAEYDFLLGNTKLTLALDDDIIKHFLENKAAFETLKDRAYQELNSRKRSEVEQGFNLLEAAKQEYQKIFIYAITSGDMALGNGINFLIGGMVDNAVGYLYVKDPKDLPKMDANRVIMLRKIGAGWYIYKTT